MAAVSLSSVSLSKPKPAYAQSYCKDLSYRELALSRISFYEMEF